MRGGRGSCGRDGRKAGSRGGWVHIRETQRLTFLQAARCPAPWKREKEDKGVAHAHAEGRGVHEKTRTCAVSLHLGVDCPQAFCDLPTPAASPLVSVAHFLLLLWASSSGSPGKKIILMFHEPGDSQPDRCSEITPPKCAERAAINRRAATHGQYTVTERRRAELDKVETEAVAITRGTRPYSTSPNIRTHARADTESGCLIWPVIHRRERESSSSRHTCSPSPVLIAASTPYCAISSSCSSFPDTRLPRRGTAGYRIAQSKTRMPSSQSYPTQVAADTVEVYVVDGRERTLRFDVRK